MSVINKQIKVDLYSLSKQELTELYKSYQAVTANGLAAIYGVPAFIANDKLFIDEMIVNQEEVTLLTNGIDLPFTLQQTKTVALVFGEGIDIPETFEQMPVFGITIDRNINLQQINLTSEAADEIFKDKVIAIWDMDGNLRTNTKSFSVQEIVRAGNYVLEKGYYAPIVCYVDASLQVIDYPNMYYLLRLLELEHVPVRVITYKDINYLRGVCPEIYAAIKLLPPNRHYLQLDEEDCLAHALVNYSDKRKALQKYGLKNRVPKAVMVNNVKVMYQATDWSNYFPIFYFLFDSKYAFRNDRLAAAIKKGRYFGGLVRSGGKTGDTSLGGKLRAHLRGYEEYIVETIENEQTEKPTIQGYQQYEDAKGLDAVSWHLLTFNYKLSRMAETAALLEIIDADAFMFADKPSLFNVENIHNLLQQDEIKIQYFRPAIKGE